MAYAATDNYPIKPVRGAEPIAFDALPGDDCMDLFEAFVGPPCGTETWLAIGTAAELRELISDNMLPSNAWFLLSAVAA